MRLSVALTATLAAGLSVVPQAEAGVVRAFYNASETPLTADVYLPLPLNPSTVTGSFSLPEAATVTLTFSGVCDSHDASGFRGVLLIMVLDNNLVSTVPAAPAIWCRGPDWPIMTSATYAKRLTAGTHTIQVKVKSMNSAGTFGSTSLVISK